ncbi:hypothetical protein HQ529_06225 [Candidatus Woesearchaeota archaeon]|nr:hypothetical protein [Candidatus Woesearchaeota archaeon]
MNKMQKSGFVAIYLIVLMISLPIYSSVVYGLYANTPYVYGNDNIRDYRRETDVLNVKVENIDFQNDYTQILKDYLLLVPSGISPLPFTTPSSVCSDGVPATCTYVATGPNTFTPQAKSGWRVAFYNDTQRNNYLGSTDTFSFYIDGEAPVVTLNQPVGTVDGLSVPFMVQELSGGGPSALCSGISEIIIYGEETDTNDFRELRRIIIDEACTSNTDTVDELSGYPISNNLVKSMLGLGNDVYDITICVDAYDRLGQPDNREDNRQCSDPFTYDLEAPSIDSFNIETMDGRDINTIYISDGDTSLNIIVTVSNDPTSTITGDFSYFNRNYADLTINCVNGLCEETITVSNTVVTGTAQITIIATDEFGNTDEYPGTFTVSVDSFNPVLESVKSNMVFDGISYVKANENSMSAVINETESGFLTQKPSLTQNPSFMGVPADTCAEHASAGQWTCNWDGFNFTGLSDGTIYPLAPVSLSGTDDAGNDIVTSSCTTECSVTADIVAPNISLDVNGGATVAVGDDLAINATFTESSSGFAGTSAASVQAASSCGLNLISCSSPETRGNLWCYWEGNVADITCMTNEITFSIEDRVGNVGEYIEKLQDDIAPKIVSLTSYGDFVGKANDFMAVINEVGAGISKENIKMTSTELDVSAKEADSCDGATGDVNCYWYNITYDGNAGSVTVSLDVADNVDPVPNTNSSSKTFNVDVTAPTGGDVFIQEIEDLRTEYFQSGDKLSIKVSGIEDSQSSSIKGMLNASEIGLSDNYEITCINTTPSEDTFECEWYWDELTPNLEIPASVIGRDKTLRFKFLDHTDNVNEGINAVIDVLESEDATEQRYVMVVSEPSPVERLDRQVLATTGNVPIFFPVSFTKKLETQQTILFEKSADCSSGLDVVQQSLFMTERLRSSSTRVRDNLKLLIGTYGGQPLQPEDTLVDSFEVDCTITIIYDDENDDKIYTETHEVSSLEIPLYRSPVDDAPLKILRDINETKDTLFATWDWITKADGIFKNMQNACLAFGGYTRLYETLEYLKIPIYAASQAFGLETVWKVYSEVMKGLEKIKDFVWGKWASFDNLIGNFGSSDIEGGPILEGVDQILGGSAKAGEEVGILKRMCAFSTCAQCFDKNFRGIFYEKLGEVTDTLPDWYTGANQWLSDNFIQDQLGVDEDEDVYGFPFSMLGDLSDPDKVTPYLESSLSPDKSFITAVSCACVPAIISHMQRWRGIQCEYIDCLKDSAVTLYNTEGCANVREWNECLYVTGSITNFIPLTDAVEKAVNVLASLINDAPARAITATRNTLCESLDKIDPAKDNVLGAIEIPPLQSISCGILDAVILGYDFGEWEDYMFWTNWDVPWTEANVKDPCTGIYCDDDNDCSNNEKCFDGVCFDLGEADILV